MYRITVFRKNNADVFLNYDVPEDELLIMIRCILKPSTFGNANEFTVTVEKIWNSAED